MKPILKILLLVLPIPFLISHYVPLEIFSSYTYMMKHGLVLLILVISIINHFPFKRLSKFKPYFFASFSIFMTYLFLNLFLKSEVRFIYVFYLLSYIVLFLFAFSLSRIINSISLMKFPYYSIVFLLFSTIIFSLVYDIYVYSEWSTLISGETKKRWTFGYYHPGYLASFIMVCGILSHFLIKHNLISKWNYLIIIICFFIIYLTQTRNSLIAFSIFILISHSKNSYKLFKLLVISSSSVLFFLLITDWQYLNIIGSGRFSTWISHFVYNFDSFNFLTGTGIGNAKRIGFSSNFNSVSENEMIFHVDNFYFEIFLQFGIIGLFLLIFVVMMLFQTVSKSVFTGYNKRVLIAIFFTLIFYAFFDSSFFTTGNIVSVLLWTLFFVQLNLNYMKKSF